VREVGNGDVPVNMRRTMPFTRKCDLERFYGVGTPNGIKARQKLCLRRCLLATLFRRPLSLRATCVWLHHCTVVKLHLVPTATTVVSRRPISPVSALVCFRYYAPVSIAGTFSDDAV